MTVFTTFPEAEFSAREVLEWYRLRWQIELVFKTWKSILAIHKIRSAKLPRIMCEVYGKLILAALSITLTAVGERSPAKIVLSLHRVMQHLRTVAALWTCAIFQGPQALAAFLDALATDLIRLCRKKSQRTKPSIETRLQHALASQPLSPAISP